MKTQYRGHQPRTEEAEKFWQQVVADYNAGIPAQEIAQRYRNPLTGKHYTRQHIYWILQKYK